MRHKPKSIRYGSVCSGVEAASLAWEPLGWTPAWFSEIDAAASGVLAYHWPDVPNLGDMLELDAEQCADIDVLVGGTPCQSFSVAGLRKGLQDDRGNLTLSFVRLAEAIDAVRLRRGQPPLIIVWENVPGVFSDSDNAFGCFLGGMAGEDEPLVPSGERWTNAGYVLGPSRTVAWRVLNAQYFGVPQRRRRVFVIASAREGFDPGEVLFESEGLRGDTPASGEARKEAPGDVAGCLGGNSGGRGWNNDLDRSGAFVPMVSPPLCAGAKAGGSATQQDAESGALLPVSVALRGREGGSTAELGGEVASALRGGDGGGSKSFVLTETAATVRAADGHHGHSSPRGDGSDNPICTAQNTGQGYWKESDIGETLRCSGKGGENRNANLAVFGGNKTSGPRDVASACLAHGGPAGHGDFESESFVVSMSENQRAEIRTSDVVPNLSSGGGKPGMGFPCIAFGSKDSGGDAMEEISPTLRAGGHDKSHPNAGVPPAVAFNARQDPDSEQDKTGPLDTDGHSQAAVYQCHGNNVGPLGHLRRGNGNVTGGVPFMETNLRVRRLMPVETERLQGMPDGHTARTVDKDLADGPRYKLVGNSMAEPVMRWLGWRIRAVIRTLMESQR